jgi:crotonobetainyl-CoA:carnitine CoA-transferase CaiB-like acyl-CoA transferase
MSDPHYADPAERRAHATQLREDLSAIFADRSASEWEHLLMEAGVPAGRVRTIPEAIAEPQTAARGMLRRLASADLDCEVTVPAAAFKLDGEAPSPAAPPRRAGADTTAILEELGYDTTRIAELASLAIIATEA